MNLFFAQAATPTTTPASLVAGLLDEKSVAHGLAFTDLLLLYLGVAIGVYLVLLIAGRIAKRRFHLPLGWVYHLFCFSMALFVPSLLPSINFAGEENIDAAAVLTTAFVAISFLRHYIFGLGSVKAGGDEKVPKFLSQLVSIVLVLLAIAIVARYVYGAKDIPGLLAGAGIIGIVLGIALKDTLENIFSGFAIFFGGQFKKGDWLKVGENHAEIMEINWRSARLRTTDNVYLDIPNSVITRDAVTNFSHPTALHALRLEIGLEYDAPPTKVREVLTEAALTTPYVMSDPPPRVYLHDFAASSVIYQIKFWTKDHSKFNDMLSGIRVNMWYGLRRHNITIPYPIQTEIHIEPPAPTDKKPLIREALRKVFFFESLNESQRAHLENHSKLLHFGMDEHLIRQGQSDSSMYVILRGHAEVWVEAGGSSRSVAQIGPGDCIGEMSLLTGEKRSATIKALDDMQVVEIDKATLAPVIEEQPTLLETLSDLLARRRMQNEGVLTQAMGEDQLAEKRKDYKSNFLNKLKFFFEI